MNKGLEVKIEQSGDAREKRYKPSRMSTFWKGLAAFDIGGLATLKEAFLGSEDLEAEIKKSQETGRPLPGEEDLLFGNAKFLLWRLSKKLPDGYRAVEEIERLQEERYFTEISSDYQQRIEAATYDAERRRLSEEFDSIVRSRQEALDMEAKKKAFRDSVLSAIGKVFK